MTFVLAFLIVAVLGLIAERVISPNREKATRAAIQKIGKELNRRVSFYDFSEDASLYVLDYTKERKNDNCPFDNGMKALVDVVNKHSKSFGAIEKHFNFKIVQENIPAVSAREEVKVVSQEVAQSEKVGKKSKKRRK